MVTRMCTRAMPSSPTSTESTIPSSGRGRWISASITPFSASWMAATRSSPGFSAVVTAVPSCGGGGICSRLGGGGTRGVLRSESLALLRERGGDLLAQQGAQGVDVGLRGGRLVELLEQVTQLAADEVARGDVIQRQAQRGDLAGDEVGGGVVALVGLAILLGLDAVAVVLPVLGEQQQRRGVRGLQREDQREQGEVQGARVELGALGRERVPGEPHRAEQGHAHEERGRAHHAR